jgi:hypothetical protein
MTPISTTEKNDMMRRATVECLDHRDAQIYLGLDLSSATCIVAQLQLALRHPVNRGASASIIRKLITEIITDLEMQGLPTTAALLRLGDNPDYDEVRA